MRVALLKTVLAFGSLLPAGVAAAATPVTRPTSAQPAARTAATKDPTPTEIRRAVARAERSRSLWATVNVCDTRKYPHTIGVRGQMPGLGFPAWLSMRVQVNYYDKSKHRFLPDAKAVKLVRLGRSSSLLQQGGTAEQFPAHSGYFNAKITFIWRRSGKLLGQTTRRTTAGHRSADFGDPKHYSAKQCLIR